MNNVCSEWQCNSCGERYATCNQGTAGLGPYTCVLQEHRCINSLYDETMVTYPVSEGGSSNHVPPEVSFAGELSYTWKYYNIHVVSYVNEIS